MQKLNISTEQGTALQGVLFSAQQADTVMIAITGIHGIFIPIPFITTLVRPCPQARLILSMPKLATPSGKLTPSIISQASLSLSALLMRIFALPSKM
ncbi:hypothetical protein [Moraxella cuniculi]|uniref:hypothetical protein n=1 Tax=Moraxella cuniculi TaxID=34061 RepID=UPI0018D500C7|nr:hypothetical protein [Moraxella cuniculi]